MTNSPPTVAVVMATHNPNPSYLFDQIKAINCQSLSADELIIVDDCSRNIHDVSDILKSVFGPSFDDKCMLIRNHSNVGNTKTFGRGALAKNPQIYCLTYDFYPVNDLIIKTGPTEMECAVAANLSPAVAGHGYATVIRIEIVGLLTVATDDRGGHDGWIRTFGDILEIRAILRLLLVYCRRHENSHSERTKITRSKEVSTFNRLSYVTRIQCLDQELKDLKDIVNWLESSKAILRASDYRDMNARTMKLLNSLNYRRKLLKSPFLAFLCLILFVKTKHEAVDVVCRILSLFGLPGETKKAI